MLHIIVSYDFELKVSVYVAILEHEFFYYFGILFLVYSFKWKKLQVRNKVTGKIYIVGETRLAELPVEKAKKDAPNGAVNDSKTVDSKSKGSSGGKSKNATDTYEVLDKFSGASLVGTK